MAFEPVGTKQFVILAIGLVIWLAVPAAIAIWWKVKKKEPMTTILLGAATFLLFALVLEKPIQNVLLFPAQMGLKEHAVSRFVGARPVLWALLVGLFPGVFEETGRLVTYQTVLKKRRHRETSISHGIGHGGFEVLLMMGLTYFQNIVYAIMINTGTFQLLMDQVAAQAPEQLETGYAIASQLAVFSFGSLGIGIVERVFAVAFHVGASILVFYACKDRKKFWLYPLAILVHTLMDAFAGLTMVHVIDPPLWVLEAVIGVVGIATFLGAYCLLYRKDRDGRPEETT